VIVAEETRRHVELLRAGLPNELVTPMWSLKAKSSRYARSATAAAATATQMEGDIYVSVAVVTEETARKLGHRKRVKEEAAAGLVGLTLDLDVIGTPDGKGGTKQTGAPSIEVAITAASLIAEPTVIIASGGGVQPWWLFEEPWIFSSQEEREHAKRVSARWQEAHRQRCGFAIDPTHDLARLMRLAGTRNYKGGGMGAPVRIVNG
jgi:hypothetical protein